MSLARDRRNVYGENDNRINSQLPAVAAIMAQLRKPFSADSYPGTGHGFLIQGRDNRAVDGIGPTGRWDEYYREADAARLLGA